MRYEISDDLAYVTLVPDRAAARTVELSSRLLVDVDAQGEPIGIEAHGAAPWVADVVGSFPTLAERQPALTTVQHQLAEAGGSGHLVASD